MRTALVALITGVVLAFAGAFLANLVQTTGGTTIEDIRIPLDDGSELSAYLYTPSNATEANPAPGILAVHGYINSRETQSSFAIEFARRGYVVLALDQSGHGYSTNTAVSTGFGGPAGLAYLRSLPFVDTSKIGMEGHSMGGWTILSAAMADPEGYQSVALVGSSTGAPFAAPGTPEWPRNLAVIFSKYDEFGPLMWGVERATDAPTGSKLQAVFGTDDPVQPRTLYGDMEAGTARWLTQPNTTHPGDHLSFEATADAMEWMQLTLGAPNPLPTGNQVWHWKETGTFIALIGGLLSMLGCFALINILTTPTAAAEVGTTSTGFSPSLMIIALVSALVPAIAYFPLTEWGGALANNSLLPQNITNQIMVWALGCGAVSALGLLVRRDFTLSPAFQGVMAALLSVGLLLFISVISQAFFKSDMRLWVVALKPPGAHHIPIIIAYLLPFLAFFYVSQAALIHGFLKPLSPGKQVLVGWTISAGGITGLIVLIYAILFATGKLPGVADPLFAIVGIQFIPVLAITTIAAIISWRTSRAVLPGAVLSALFVTWYIVAGQATHV